MKRLLWLVCCLATAVSMRMYGADGGVSESTVTSAAVRLETRTSFGGRMARGTVAVSAVAEQANANARLTVDGSTPAGWSTGTPQWTTTAVADGWHTAVLNEGTSTSTVDLAVLNSDTVTVHGGTLTASETWSKSTVHIVRNWVRIPAGKTLTISSGAIVKFCQGTGIQNDGTLKATGVTMTLLEDDAVGGDTDMNGPADILGYGGYDITGSGTKTLTSCDIRYPASLPVNTTWKAGSVNHIYGTLKVPGGVTLTIQSGAIVKLASGAELAAAGGSITANGVLFTHIADDSEEAGGDTNGDGDATSPMHDAYKLTGFTPASDCELRYITLTYSGGTIASGQTKILMGNRVHKVTGNITIASGGKLVVQPGAIVKMNKGLSITVSSGGTLEALGNRAQPIVFTSYRDDEHGGDTDGDDGEELPEPGDWRQLIVQGTLKMDYCRVLYPAGENNQGAIYINGGNVDFSNGEISHTVYDCCRSYGTGRFVNSVFSDSSMGFAPASGSNTVINCVFYNITTMVRWSAGSFANCVFLNGGEFIDSKFYSSTIGMPMSNCVFYNEPSYNGQRSCPKVGSNGNQWADPLFTNPAKGDFTLKAGSPCIDAGDGTVAPATDYWGKPRMDVVKMADRGTPNADGVCPDIGIYEMPGSNTGSSPNLVVSSVTGPSSVTTGGTITVEWQILNDGSATAAGPWRDTVVLKGVDEALGGQVVELGEATVSASLTALDTLTVTRSFTVPPLKAGVWQLGVTANSYRDVYETKRGDNQAFAEATLKVTLPKWSSTNKSFTVAAFGETGFSVASSTSTRVVMITVPAGAKLAAYGADGYLPSADNAAATAVALADGRLMLVIPANTASPYVTLENLGGSAAKATVAVSTASLNLYEATPSSLTNGGTATMRIIGTGLTSASTFTLSNGSTTVTGTLVSLENSAVATVQFPMGGRAAGSYTLSVRKSSSTASLASQIAVTSNGVGPKLEAWLETPASVRDGRIYTAWLCYRNSGDCDMTMPLFEVGCASGTKLSMSLADEFAAKPIYLAGIGKNNPVGVLKAGEENRVPFYFTLSGSCNITLKRITEKATGIPEEFNDYEDYASAMSSAATRLNLRGKEVFDIISIQRMAVNLKKGLPVAAVSGVVINKYTGLPLVNYDMSLVGSVYMKCTTDEKGYFVFPELPDGDYHVEVEHTYGLENSSIVINDGMDVKHNEIRVYPFGELKGYVLEANTDAPLADMHVYVQLKEGDIKFEGITDDTGFFIIKGIPSESYLLGVKSENGYIPDKVYELVYEGGNISDNYILYMEQGGIINGNVSFNGTVVTSGMVTATNSSNDIYVAEINENGKYAFLSLPEGKYVIGIQSEEYDKYDKDEVNVSAGQNVDYDLSADKKAYFYASSSLGACPFTVNFEVLTDKLPKNSTLLQWDFDGDGKVDKTGEHPDYIYKTPGLYDVTLIVTKADGKKETVKHPGYIRVVKKVETVLQDNAFLLNDEKDLTLGSFDENSGTLVLKGKTLVTIAKDTVIAWHDDNGNGFLRKVTDVHKKDNVWTLQTVVAQVTEFYKTCYIEVPVSISGVELQPMQTRGAGMPTAIAGGGSSVGGGSYDFNIPFDILEFDNEGDVYTEFSEFIGSNLNMSVKGNIMGSAQPVQGTFKKYINLGQIYCTFDTIIDYSASVSFDFSGEFKADMLKMINKKLYEAMNKRHMKPLWYKPIFVPQAFFYGSLSFYLDTSMSLYIKGNFDFSQTLTYSNKQKVTLTLDARPGESFYFNCDAVQLERNVRAADGSDYEIYTDSDADASASFDASIHVKPTIRIAAYEVAAATVGADISISLNAEAGTDKPTKIYLGPGLEFFGSAYLVDLDFIGELEKGASKYLPTATEAEKKAKDKAKDFGDWLKSIKFLGKSWKSSNLFPFKELISSEYEAPEPDFRVTPEYGKVPLTCTFSALATGGKATGFFESECFPKVEGYTWRFGDLQEDNTGVPSVKHTYNKKGHFDSSLSLKVRPIPSFMRTQKRVWAGDEEPPPSGDAVIPPGVQKSPQQSCDPNEIAGMVGYGDKCTQRYVKPGEWLDYTVYFENKASAAVPAQEVTVTHFLSRWLDWSTLELGEIAFNNQIQMELKGKCRGTATVAQNGTPYHVRMTASTDESTGEFVLYLRSYDKARQAYGYWPEPVDAGFLPPNDDTHRGEGHFTFRVKVRDDAPDGAFVNAEASVVFDQNEAIVTSPAWFNWVLADETKAWDADEFHWDTTGDAAGTTYTVEVWSGAPETDSDERTVVQTVEGLTKGVWTPSATLEPGDYYWRVKKTAKDGTESWTSAWGFTVEASYTVTVTNGTGGGTYRRGDAVTVTAAAAPAGKVFGAWSATGLTLTEDEQVSDTLFFLMPDHDVALTASYVAEDVPGGDSQTLALSAGWNWIGFTVLPETKTVGAVLGTAGFSKNDIILGADVQSTFTGSTWLPSSVELSFGTLYQVYVAKDVTVTVRGTACASNTLQLSAGWNWIANSTAAAVTPKELKFGGGLAANDLMISATSQVTYTGKSWLPSSGFTLEPGAGCQVYVAKGGTLTFPSPSADEALYAVVDLSGGPSATAYPVRYSATGPDLEDDTCRTTELWLRKIPAGTFTMGSPENEIGRKKDETQHEVTLTQDYYIGVFECTQKQWELVMGSNPSKYAGDGRPVEQISYSDIRGTGAQAGAGWPLYGHAVDATSFMGKLQAKTGLVFDLPTEAQWEYACRAGIATALGSGENLTDAGEDAAMTAVGRYWFNRSDGRGGCKQHTKAGCYQPNAWGLYDMHGNVIEFCLDWYDVSYGGLQACVDPVGPQQGENRLLCGGGWDDYADCCRSANRYSNTPAYKGYLSGFRVAIQPMAEDTYAVVDLSGGANANSYPVRYSATGPDLADDTCRTTELWLRKIPAGTFMMGSPEDELGRCSGETQHEVTLTQDYYIGVFECTQKQWELVMGTKPSYFNNAQYYATRPVERVSYNEIRGTGAQAGAGWPTYGHAVDGTSFMGKLQAKTGLTFDLPTEAQWEYACRAGTTTALNSGENLTNTDSDAAMDEAGRYWCNGGSGYSSSCTDQYGTAKVGSYQPNAWGLYDTHGNVYEWCLDRYTSSLGSSSVTDPVGHASGSYRVIRGGSWINYADYCRSARRGSSSPSYYDGYIGFRVGCLLLVR